VRQPPPKPPDLLETKCGLGFRCVGSRCPMWRPTGDWTDRTGEMWPADPGGARKVGRCLIFSGEK
jgi:hypothetical protein